MKAEKTKFETITEAQERYLVKRLEKNISLKKLNLWFESLESTFKNNSDILDFIKMLKLKGRIHYVKLSLYMIEKNNKNFKILKRTEYGLAETHEHMGTFKIELLEKVINELLEECNYISILEDNRIVQIIESGAITHE